MFFRFFRKRLLFPGLVFFLLTEAVCGRAGAAPLTEDVPDSNRVIIRQINLIGNKITRDHIVFRELSFKTGDTLQADELEKIFLRSEQNLFNTRLFNTTKITWLRDGQDVRTYIIMTERWYVFPLPIFEVVDRNFNAWWETKDFDRIVYGLALSWRNFRGRNELFTTSIRLGYIQRLSFSYGIPFIDRQRRIGIGFSGSYLRNREVTLKTDSNRLVFFKDGENFLRKEYGGGVGITFRPALYESHVLEGAYRHAQVADTVAELNPDFFNNKDSVERFFSFRYMYRLNRLDISVYPLKGYYFDFEIGKNGFAALGDDISLLYLAARYKRYWQLKDRFYAAASINGKVSGTSFQPYYNIRALGYGKDVIRGYEYYVIDGQHFLLGKSALKFELLPKKELHAGFVPSPKFNSIPISLYLSLFADAGYVWDRQFYATNNMTNSLQFGYGAGLDLFTYYDVVFRLEYSFNKLGESGFFLHFSAPI